MIRARFVSSLPRLRPAVVAVQAWSEETRSTWCHPAPNSESASPTCCQPSLSSINAPSSCPVLTGPTRRLTAAQSPASSLILISILGPAQLHDHVGSLGQWPSSTLSRPLDSCVSDRSRTARVPVSFRDWAAEDTNYPREVIEAALAHVVQNKVEAAYARSDLFERRRLLMDDWVSAIDAR